MSDDDAAWDDSDFEEQQEKKEEEKAKNDVNSKFKDENVVDQDAIKRQKQEEEKKRIEEQMANSRAKEGAKIDFDKKFEERQKALGGGKVDTTGMTSKQAAEAQNQQDQDAFANQLLGDDDDQKTSLNRPLNNEKDYK